MCAARPLGPQASPPPLPPLLAGALAVPAGLLPIWGLLSSRGAPLVVPLPEVVAALAVLPLLAMAGTLLFSRPIPDWSAFRSAAT